MSIKLVMDGESGPVHFQEFQSAVNAVEISVKLDPAAAQAEGRPRVLERHGRRPLILEFLQRQQDHFRKTGDGGFQAPHGGGHLRGPLRHPGRYRPGDVQDVAGHGTKRDPGSATTSFPATRDIWPTAEWSLAFFSHPYDVSVKERAMVFAEDHAGNTRESALVYNVRPLRYRRSKVPVSDDFIRHKIVPAVVRCRRLRRQSAGPVPPGQSSPAAEKRGDHPQDLPELRGKETVGRPLLAVARLRGSGQFCRSALVLLSKTRKSMWRGTSVTTWR